MKYILIFMSLFLVLATIYLAPAFIELKQHLLKVHDVENKYALSSEGEDLSVVDFSRFGCPHCQALQPVLRAAIKKDGKIRYVPRLVTFGQIWDETLASAVYAAAEQGKFIEMRDAIYKNWPVETRKDLLIHARSVGLNIEKLTRDMTDPEIIERMRKDQAYFEAWNLGRTPAIVIGENMVYSPAADTPTVEDLEKMFERARR